MIYLPFHIVEPDYFINFLARQILFNLNSFMFGVISNPLDILKDKD